jgi:hypothetical protein
MPPPTGPRTPGYRFKDGKLMIFSERDVMLIRGWEEPTAIKKATDSWDPFVPEFHLIAPFYVPSLRSAKRSPGVTPPKPRQGAPS